MHMDRGMGGEDTTRRMEAREVVQAVDMDMAIGRKGARGRLCWAGSEPKRRPRVAGAKLKLPGCL